MNQRQTAGIVNEVLGMTVAESKAMAQQFENDVAELKKEYGPNYDDRTKLADETLRRAVEKSGGDYSRLTQALALKGLSNQPDLIRALSSLGRTMQQDKIWGAGGEPRSMSGASRTELEAQLADIKIKHESDLLQDNDAGRMAQIKIDKIIDQMAEMA